VFRRAGGRRDMPRSIKVLSIFVSDPIYAVKAHIITSRLQSDFLWIHTTGRLIFHPLGVVVI
jgi:hypothetical protein